MTMDRTNPPPWVAPENDYRGIMRRRPVAEPSVSIVIPAYNRSAVLARTLAGIAGLAFPPDRLEVIVADDGSDEDLTTVVEATASPFPLRFVRQERAGFGAGRARNLGAAHARGDVLVFLDSDCVPDPDLIDQHLRWHSRASNVVVVGARHDVDAGEIPAAQIGAAIPQLRAALSDGGEEAPSDWRRVLYRRSKGMLIGDLAYRACLSNNLSMYRDPFEAVGGFSEDFHTWGGEDTELGWRLWNDGAFVVAEQDAVAYHQIQDDPSDGRATRMESREHVLALVADRVPHRFYRKVATPFASVPKVSWLLMVGTAEEADTAWTALSDASYPDAEIVMVGPEPALRKYGALDDPAAKAKVMMGEGPDAIGRALRATRGEIVVIVDGRAGFDRRLLARIVKRFERDPRAAAARVPYDGGFPRLFRRLGDLEEIDRTFGHHGMPLLGAARRRELFKDPLLLDDPAAAWQGAVDRGAVLLLSNDVVSLPGVEPERAPRSPGIRDARSIGARHAVSLARDHRRGEGIAPVAETVEVAETEIDDRIPIEYIGYTGRDNLGDEAMLAAVQALMPWADVARETPRPRMLMLGGGTLVNGRNYYLTRILRNDGPTLERAVFGSGVRSPRFWGVTERMEEWWSFFDASLLVSVRGPDSVRYLRDLGYEGQVEIIGDPALSLPIPSEVERVEGRVVLCPVFTAGRLWGEDDQRVFEQFATTLQRLRAEGREVVMMTAFPNDDRWAIEIMRRAGAPDMPYLSGYEDLNETSRLLSSADLVIGERLHSVVLAAAVGTPFVAVEYRPKLRDFARSVGRDDAVVRTDEIDRLDATVDTVLAEGPTFSERVTEQVEAYRVKQREAADGLRWDLEGDA
jgi:glycosyltransferase involved in cell wall biosynthesis